MHEEPASCFSLVTGVSSPKLWPVPQIGQPRFYGQKNAQGRSVTDACGRRQVVCMEMRMEMPRGFGQDTKSIHPTPSQGICARNPLLASIFSFSHSSPNVLVGNSPFHIKVLSMLLLSVPCHPSAFLHCKTTH